MKSEFIMYHYVRILKKSKFPKIKGLDLQKFINQINFLSKNYNILSIEDFYFKKFPKNKKKNCVLTFDDGYSDHYKYVFEILKKKNLKAAFFSPVDIVTSKSLVLDVNKIHLILASANENKVFERLKYHYNKTSNSEIKLDNFINKIIFNNNRYDTKTTIIIKQLLQSVLDENLRSIICDNLLNDFVSLSLEEINKDLYLTFDQAKEMVKEGMHFGSHGKSHFWFDSLSKDEQENEIIESISFLDKLYGHKKYLLTMCYPYGNYNLDTLSLVKKHNFKIGLNTISNIFDSTRDNLFEIPRMDTNDYSS